MKEKENTLYNLDREKLLPILVSTLEEFICNYPLCPLSFLLPQVNSNAGNGEFVNALKSILQQIYIRNSQMSIFSAAVIVYNQFINGNLVVNHGTQLADFPEVRHYPTTEKSKKVASSILAAIKIFQNPQMLNSKSNWQNYFWQTTYNLEPCKM